MFVLSVEMVQAKTVTASRLTPKPIFRTGNVLGVVCMRTSLVFGKLTQAIQTIQKYSEPSMNTMALTLTVKRKIQDFSKQAIKQLIIHRLDLSQKLGTLAMVKLDGGLMKS